MRDQPESRETAWFRIPCSTYRLQLCEDFTFNDTTRIVPYLKRLGISDCFSSPILKARSGSTHGYDVTDHHVLNPEIGTTKEFDRFVKELHGKGMGLVLDIVPNHMAMSDENPLFMAVLEDGPFSKYSNFFDIDWASQNNKILLPILGSDLQSEILEHNISLASKNRLKVYDSMLPLNPQSLLGSDSSIEKIELEPILSKQFYKLEYWKSGIKKINYRRFSTVNDLIAISVENRAVYEESHKLILDLVAKGKVSGLRIDHIDGLYDPSGYLSHLQRDCQEALEESGKNRATRADNHSPFFIVVEKILEEGEKLRTDWEVSGTTGYEFLNDLNGIYVEEKNSLIFDKIYSSFILDSSSLKEVRYACRCRIIDSSLESDLSRLSNSLSEILFPYSSQRAHRIGSNDLKTAIREVAACFPVYRTYITGEAIVTPNDARYINYAIREARQHLLSKKYKSARVAVNRLRRVLLLDFPRHVSLSDVEKRKWKTFVMRFQQFTAPISAKGVEDTAFYKYNRLISLNEVGGNPDTFGSSIKVFHKKNLERLRTHPNSLLTTSTHDTKRSADVRARINVLSEIPKLWNDSLVRWSEINKGARSTSGGKRCPSANDEYMLYQTMLGVFPHNISSVRLELIDRISAFMIKAIREEKKETSWFEPNIEYEEGVRDFIRKILSKAGEVEREGFIHSFKDFHMTISYRGMLNSLSQLLLHLTCPGIPDIYQGNEVWDYSLVDPDNRRAVDYRQRKQMLSYLELQIARGMDELLKTLVARMESGLIKMFVLKQVLGFRNRKRELFERGDYLPLKVSGAKKRHIVAFMRRFGRDECIVVAPRFFVSLLNGRKNLDLTRKGLWKDTAIMISSKRDGVARNRGYQNIFTNRSVSTNELDGNRAIFASEVFDQFPIALLASC